jgi:hypothetical protein
MNRATSNARKRPRATVTAGAGPERHERDATSGHPFSVTAPHIDRRYRSRPYAVTSRIGSITRTERYSDPQAAARGAEQARRDLALLAARLDGRR